MVEKKASSESERNNNLKWVDPVGLVGNNPAALVVNHDSYELIAASISPLQLDPPQIAKVTVVASSGKETILDLVIDGMTRTKVIRDKKLKREAPPPDFPDFSYDRILVRDVTESSLKNPLIVPPKERIKGQRALTTIQYLRAVVPPTREHASIVNSRIAALLVNAWANMVGEQVAERYSAVSALSFLARPEVPSVNAELFEKFLKGQDEIVAKETKNERALLETAFLQTAEIIRESRVFKESVARAAFMLVASASPTIGGEQEMGKQVYGLLHAPAVEEKISRPANRISERERLRSKLGQTILEKLAKYEGDREKALAVFNESLTDQDLNLNEVFQILNAREPQNEYSKIKQDINSQQLRDAFLKRQGKRTLTPQEASLVEHLGRKTVLATIDLPVLSRSIVTASEALQKADTLQSALEKQRSEILKSGVSSQTMGEAINGLVKVREAILAASSSIDVSRKSQELNNLVINVERVINDQITRHKATAIVTENYTGKLPGTTIVAYLMSEVQKGTVDLKQERQVKQYFKNFQALDEDLQAKVVNGEMRMSRAQQVQEERKRSPQKPPVESEVKPARLTISYEPPLDIRPTFSVGRAEIPKPEQKKPIENKRLEINNNSLQASIQRLVSELSSLDLESKELDSESKILLDNAIRQLGKLRFDHPDIVRVIEKDYPELLARLKTIREKQVRG